MLADQVVQPVAAAGGLGEQALVIQGIQAAAGGGQVGAVQGGGRVGVDIGPGVQAQAAEQQLLAGGEVGVGQVERGGDRHILRRHQLQPVPRRGQVAGQPGRGPGRMVVQLAGQHPDRQRQAAAQPDNLRDRRVARLQIGPGRQPDQ